MKHINLISIMALGFFIFSEASAKTIVTEEKGERFTFEKTKTLIEVSPHSKVVINENETPESISLELGMARAHVQKALDASDKPSFVLKTRAATMGVRGTDFVGIANPVLGESEIIVFDGKVDFTSVKDATDTKQVPAGHWGGIGGRFGATTHELIALSRSAILYFDQTSHVKK